MIDNSDRNVGTRDKVEPGSNIQTRPIHLSVGSTLICRMHFKKLLYVVLNFIDEGWIGLGFSPAC